MSCTIRLRLKCTIDAEHIGAVITHLTEHAAEDIEYHVTGVKPKTARKKSNRTPFEQEALDLTGEEIVDDVM